MNNLLGGVRYRYVPPSHYIPQWKAAHPELECARVAFPPNLAPCKFALVARDDAQMVGFLRFWFSRRHLYAGGTWVESFARGRGVASGLWRRVLEKYDPRCVSVRTISNEGRSLVAALMRDYPGMTWEITT